MRGEDRKVERSHSTEDLECQAETFALSSVGTTGVFKKGVMQSDL